MKGILCLCISVLLIASVAAASKKEGLEAILSDYHKYVKDRAVPAAPQNKIAFLDEDNHMFVYFPVVGGTEPVIQGPFPESYVFPNGMKDDVVSFLQQEEEEEDGEEADEGEDDDEGEEVEDADQDEEDEGEEEEESDSAEGNDDQGEESEEEDEEDEDEEGGDDVEDSDDSDDSEDAKQETAPQDGAAQPFPANMDRGAGPDVMIANAMKEEQTEQEKEKSPSYMRAEMSLAESESKAKSTSQSTTGTQGDRNRDYTDTPEAVAPAAPACPPQLHVHMYYPYQTPWTHYFHPMFNSPSHPFNPLHYMSGAMANAAQGAQGKSGAPPSFLQTGEKVMSKKKTSHSIRRWINEHGIHSKLHAAKHFDNELKAFSRKDGLKEMRDLLAKKDELVFTNDMELPPAPMPIPTNSEDDPCPPARPQLHLHLYDPTAPHFGVKTAYNAPPNYPF